MVSVELIKARAWKMAVATGQMPEVEFIWSMQRSQGTPVCFGQGKDCQKKDCRWRCQCMELEEYANISWEVLTHRNGGELTEHN